MDKISVISNDIYKIISAPSYAFVISMFDGTGAGTISPVDARWYYKTNKCDDSNTRRK